VGKRRQDQKNADAGPAEEKLRENRLKAMRLRVMGYSYPRIADEMKCSLGTAFNWVTEGLKEAKAINASTAEELRAVEAERLDIAIAAVMPTVEKGSPVAIASLVRLQERRAKLLNLDMPTKGDEAAAATARALALLLGVSEEEIFPGGFSAADS
jgi:hypothetical protein